MLHRKRIIIGSALVLASLGAFSNAAHAQSVFADVPDNHWASAAVKRLAEAGIIEGRPGVLSRSATQANTAQSHTAQEKSAQTTMPLAKSSSVSRQKPEQRTTASSKAPQRVVSAAASKKSSASSLSGNSR
jgi:hypothetical protein